MYEDIGHSNEARKTMKKYLIGNLEVGAHLIPFHSYVSSRPQIHFISQNQATIMTSRATLHVILRILISSISFFLSYMCLISTPTSLSNRLTPWNPRKKEPRKQLLISNQEAVDCHLSPLWCSWLLSRAACTSRKWRSRHNTEWLRHQAIDYRRLSSILYYSMLTPNDNYQIIL